LFGKYNPESFDLFDIFPLKKFESRGKNYQDETKPIYEVKSDDDISSLICKNDISLRDIESELISLNTKYHMLTLTNKNLK
jgi:hypothetical protein